jgi:hypothetical protein
MANSTNNYQLLISNLDKFIRKFYVNQLIRGFLYFFALVLVLFLGMNFLEHFFYFGSATRKVMFYSFMGVSAVSFVGWVLIPLLKYFHLGTVISHEQAAGIIGDHFPNVKDKLLNVLQLSKQAEGAPNAELVFAGINQKTEKIKLVPFKSAIDLGKNRKHLKYALPPLMLLFFILLAAPSLIKDSSNRLYNNDKEFERDAPFHFNINKEDLTVVQFEDFLLEVEVEGDVLPNEVFVDIDNYQYRLNKDEQNKFSYRFSNVQKNTDFKIFSSGVESEKYNLNVLKKPNILGFDITLDYPNYIGRKDETLSNIGDLVIPIGTKINWNFNASNTDEIAINFFDKKNRINTDRAGEESFSYRKQALRDEIYKLYISNKALPNADSVGYSITVIPDLYPTIKSEKFVDSVDSKLLFFVGDAADDYGILNLSFNYRVKKENGQQGELVNIKMAKPSTKTAQFDYTFDLQELDLKPGDEVSYYFQVFDNDAVNGSKSAKTNLELFEMPTLEELEEKEDQNNEDIQKKLEESLKKSKKIQEDMKKMREKVLQKKELDWQDRKELEKLLDQQKQLEEDINEAKDKFEENMKNQEEFEQQPNEELQEKQEQMQEMFEELMSDEMKELMKQIEDLLQELNKDQALEMMEEMEMNDEEVEMELDRMIEMLKQLEMEKDMMEQIEELEKLAKEQEELAKETEEESKPQEELEKKQEEINEKFDEIQKKQEEMEKKNKEMENPKDLGEKKEEMEDIEKDLDDSKKDLEKKENKKASGKQKKAAGKMKEMAEQMQMDMEAGEMEQLEEDMAALRQLLENLMTLSFDQEDVIDNFSVTGVTTPRYVDLVQEQYKLKDDFQLVEDSLQALSKRVFQIESFVTEKVHDVKVNMKEGLTELEARKKPQASEHQQRTMKNVNDLALMLSEVMNQMQQQMSSMMEGSQMCKKPGGKPGSKPGSKPGDKMSQGQGELNKQMDAMKKALESGKKGSSKEFAKMAAKQAALRKALRDLAKEKQQKGQGDKQLQEIIEQMDKVETDLVNKRLTNEMLKRQQDIMTRLLKAEKAERQREYEEKRKAETASQKERKMPPSLEEYIKKREAEIEMFKTVSPSLRPYYKMLVEEYYKSLKAN